MNAAPEPALDAARQIGVVPAEVKRLCDHWLARKPMWGIGALYRRIQNARPGQAADDPATWPKPSKEFEDMKRREARRSAQIERQAAAEAERHQVAADEQRAAETEEAYGPLLDQMSAESLDRFAREALAGNRFLEKLFRAKGIESPLVREHLLDALAAAEAVR